MARMITMMVISQKSSCWL